MKNSIENAGSTTCEVMTFQFSETKNEIRNVMVNNEPYFIGSDIAKALGYKRPSDAINQHCRYTVKHRIPHPQTKEKTLEVLVIPEGDMYRLIVNSKLPTAEKFERWVMDEVLPSIRKKGYYGQPQKDQNFIDARDIPFQRKQYNNVDIRVITINNELWFSLNDLHRAVNSRTSSGQAAKKLNQKQTLAKKIHLFGNTHPAWFTNEVGVNLIISNSKTVNFFTSQLQINFGGEA